MSLQRAELEGIPVWWADDPGPFNAALHFRVGHADEPTHMTGITHLAEHLALWTVRSREHPFNGLVDATTCIFGAEGERDEVLEFLRLVAGALAEPDGGGLSLERRVLRAEAAGRGADVVGRLLAWRFGVAGYGLTGALELGLRWLGAAELRAWCAARFTRGNVVVWMTGEPPADFALALRDGPRLSPPAPEPLPQRLPAFVADGTGGAAIAGLGARSHALSLATEIAQDRLYARLRHERGLAYSPYSDYRPLGAEHAHVVMGTDGRDEDADLLLDELWRCVTGLAEHGATEEELERRRRAHARWRAEPAVVWAHLAFAAECELAGIPHQSPAELDAERAAVDGSAVGAALREALSCALVLGPEGSRPPAGELSALAPEPVEPVKGERFPRPRRGLLRRRVDEEIVIGERGVTWRGQGETSTMEFTEVVAAEMRPDGELRLHLRSGDITSLAPYIWEGGERAVALARARVPADLLIPAAEPALVEAIERAVAHRIPDVRAVGAPLNQLPDELSEDEGLVDLALAVRLPGFVVGLLAVTERRVLWGATLGEVEGFSVPRRNLTRAVAQGAVLELEWDGGEAKLNLNPKGAAAEVAEAIGIRR